MVCAILLVTEALLPLVVVETAYLLPSFFPSLLGRPSPLEPWLTDGGLITLVTLGKLPAGLLMLAVFIRLRATAGTRTYLALSWPSFGTVVLWLGIQAALTLALDGLRVASGRPLVPEWIYNVYATAPSTVLLGAVVVLAAPVYEELVFRGFLLPSLSRTRIGTWGGVLLTAGLFALLHRQYDLYDSATVFVLGAALGVARVRSGSTALTILLHGLVNAVALAETVLLAR